MVTSQNLPYENCFNVDSVCTLVEILQSKTLYQPDKKAFTFLLDGEAEETSITYRELDLQARAIATRLQDLGASGDRALLIYPPGLEFIAAFFGCLYAGVVAVPAYPPRRNQSLSRLQSIVADAGATIALTTKTVLSNVERQFSQSPTLQALHWLTTDNIASDLAQAWLQPAISSDTLAFLQYTSGSTGTPKGVMVSHGNLLYNEQMLQTAFEHTEKTIYVSWLPLFHDMGLIGNMLQSLYLGRPCILMSPVAFLQRPVRWLQAISRYRATTSGGPNFAYELCVSKITNEQRETLDLSSWDIAFNGAEPVRAETLERFATAFEPCGFRREAFYPCYGMAETTLIVSGGIKAALPVIKTVQREALEQHRVVSASQENDGVRKLVGCGQTLLEQQIVIAHPDTLIRCQPHEVGEIWVSGKNVAQGYWNRPEETQATFRAYEAGTGEGPFLRTGDLGFLQDGELFVTGRLKDLIIIRGRNHYPQDIELTVEHSHPVLQVGCTAAFSVEINGQERLVVACEVERTSRRNLDVDAIGKSISQAVIEQHELEVYAILLLKTGSIPKTSSGKIQRRACRAGFLAGNLDVVGEWRTNPESKVESQRRVEEVETRLQQVLPGKQQQSSSRRTNGSQQDSSNREVHKKAQAIQAWLVSNIAERLRVNPQDIEVQQPFSRYGLDSVAAVSLSGELGDWLGASLSPTLVYDYPTIETLVPRLVEEFAKSPNSLDMDALEKTETEAKDANASDSAIAIIGLGCRFPGASDATAFWQLLRDGVDAITEVPEARWDINALYNSEPATPGKMSTRWGGFLDQVDQFDPHFFAIAPREAERIDPQQRLLLEVAWEALENAGQAPDQLAGSQTGVFIGISSSDYSRLQFEDCDRIDAYTGTGNALSIAANRLSYVLDLRGPSLAVDTACSSSLVAVHLAGQSLQNKECNLALAGGVNLILSPELTITFSQARMMATDGRCKTFSADADGYVRGEGCGVVLLKRLSDALRDGDNILAVIKGSAINQDGRSNGITAPNGPSQQAVIRQALENAGVAPAQISYVETHGTGTSLGDPIEVDSLKAVLMSDRSPNEPCVLGSVKTNIGHLEAAAGIASLIKVVLSLQHGEIPPQLHLNQLNPYISLENTSFSIPKERHPWLVGAKRRFAGVSSFGFGGTNAHVVVEEPPVPTKTAVDVERPLHLLTLSAKSENSLKLLAQRYQTFLEAYPQASIADVCFTANTGRSHFAHRRAIVAESTMQLQELLGAFVNGKQASGLVSGQVQSRNRPKIAFLFTGQGSQYVGMGRQLYETQPTFRQALERCDQLLGPYLEQSLLSLLYSASDATDLLHETAYTQPALFALEYALAQLWRSWGIVPDVVMGHSLGEYVAACVAGVFTLEEGLKLVVERSRLMQSLPHDGSMAVVFASEARVRAALSSYETRVAIGEENESDTLALDQTQVAIASGDAIVSIAAVNGPENIVISGAREAVESAIAQLQSQEITVQPLQVSHAFHSPLMAPILDEFEYKARQVKFKAPRIPLISNLTGQMLKPGEIPDASYWRRHMRETVQFSAGINVLEKQGYELFLELGPSTTLLGMGKRCLPKGRGLWLPSLKQGQDDWRVLLNSLGVLEIQGVEVNWAGFDQDYQRRRVPLPTYPFERQRYWFESNKQRDGKLMDVKESDTRLSTPQVETTPKITQPDSIRSRLHMLIAGLLHTDSAQVDVHVPFLEMGADSLVILEAVRTIETTFGVKVTIRQFFEELTTIDALATYIDNHITPEWSVKDTSQPEVESRVRSQQPAMQTSNATADSTWKDTPQPEVESGVPSQQSALPTSLNATADALRVRAIENKKRIAVSETALERIMGQQLEAMSQLSAQQLQAMSQLNTQQLQAMSQQREGLHNNDLPTDKLRLGETVASESINQAVSNPNYPAKGSFPSQRTTDASPETTSVKVKPDQANTPTIPSDRPIKPAANGGLTAEQRQHLQALIARYNKRTQKSKQQVQTERPFLADSRASAGFRWDTKEMCYPIIGQHSQGARIWDVDGNEYVDLAMGFGVHLCGHHPPFITAALEEQFKRGLQMGPRSELPGEVAKLISQLTGVERVAFCNSGTESVMTALRLARTVTGRSKIAMFAGSYHGHFDGTLVTAATVNGEPGSAPLASGVPQYMADNVLVLNYGDFQSLDTIKAHAHELAAVLVEPVQSRRPDLQPKEFLQQLRKLTAETGIALIFDEVLVGFRIHQGGAQAWFGIEADLVTYGKVIGGGLPIGVVAGKAAYMNAVDGGMWNFGDASYPQAETTYFGGTFSKHPLAMATARAVLMHMKMQGATLQEHLNERTSQLAETLNAYFQQNDVPIRMVNFGSLFRFVFGGNFSVFNQPLAMDLLFYHLLEKGVYIWEGRNCFLSTAHTDKDIEYVIRAITQSVEELQAGGFLPKPPSQSPQKNNLFSGSLSTLNNSYLAKESRVVSAKWGSNPTKTAIDKELSNASQVDTKPQAAFWDRKAYKPSLVSPKFTEIKASRNTKKTIQFSLFYFGKYDSEFVPDKYNLLFEGAKFADENGFAALWMPERHFHAFGGFSPNPSVISAALAQVTQRIQLRAGSVVLPIHHPIRVAEEWSIVDNLSKGRVGISFASGWHPNDFVFAPEAYGNHRELMFQEIETVQKLWRGESIQARDGAGTNISVKLFPMPMQPEVPIWITIVNNPETYIRAGEIGAGVLTNLMGQTVEDLAKNICLYRESLSRHGYAPESGHITVLLHTFVGDDIDTVRHTARQPFYNYLQSSLGLFKNLVKSQGLNIDFDTVTEEDKEYLLSAAYERYVQTSALIGTPDSCSKIIDNLMAIGVDEVACFIDFGMAADSVLEGLPHLNVLRERYENREDSSPDQPPSELTPTLPPETVNFDVADTVPLTDAQKQFWLLAQMGEEASSAYNESVMLQLQGSLQLGAMRKAFQKVVDRHEALRTIISSDGNFQQILPTLTIDVPLIDFSSLATAERDAKVDKWLKQESRQSFDLTQAPLLRVNILKLEEEQYLLLLSAHHIVIDGWSIGVLLQEVSAFYSAEGQGVTCPQEPPLQFKEFIQWQVQQSQSDQIATHEAYWLGQLADSIPILELPTDRTRPHVKTYRGARASMKLEASLCAELRKISSQKGCTLFITLLGAYMTWLHRLTNQDDFLVGIPVTSRTLKGSENIVGYCANLLPIRSSLVGSDAFSDYLTKIRRVLFDAYEHQDYPFSKLLDQLNLRTDPSRSPLVTAAFNLDRPTAVPKMFGLELNLVSPPISYAKFDINLNVIDFDSELLLQMDYSTDLFEAETISRMLGHFHTLLEGIVANPEERLDHLPLLTPAERHQLLVEWNNTQTDYPFDKCIHEVFEAQAEQTPDAVAVVFEDQQLTYQQLNRRANQLAHYLRSLGVGADVLVGICVERSLEMVVALLGILKAGGAYVPLDPAYPAERLTFMLEDTQLSVLLTQQQLVDKLPSHQAQVICLDSDWEAISQHSEDNPPSEVRPDHLAYVMYTSGSTGRSKGVSVIHRGVVRLVKQTNYASFSAQKVFLQLAPISFDASTFEIWGSLLNGARLVVMPPQTPSLQELGQALGQYQVTTLWLTAGLFHLMVDERLEDLKSVRQLLAGGDVLSISHVNKVVQHTPGLTLLNGYGPTENTTFTCCYPITEPSCVGNSVPIGRPIANTQVYVLNAQLQPVPVGIPGELYIGGDGLARGYLNRPELTSERFIPNPFSEVSGDRLYKTGDLVRYLSDGNIEFLGRLDDQVKIRGFRIELAEIEAVLRQHPDVLQSVAITREDSPGEKQLVAYWVANPERVPSISELGNFLKQQLPEYMIPRAFVSLDALPLTPNGKIDRRALPTPEIAHLPVETTFVAPRTPVEEILTAIWAEVLGVKQVGIYDNFFELGGHSLGAIQLISRVRSSLAVEVPLPSLFENPTISGLAEFVETALRHDQSISALPLLPVTRSETMPLSFAQQRLWFLEQLKPGNAFYNMPATVCLKGQLNVAALEQSLNQIMTRHEALRTNFVTVNGRPIQAIASTLTLTLRVVDLQQLPETEREIETQRLATEEAQQPFDLAAEPLVRTKLLQLTEAEHVLLLTMHHIVSDGWSIGVFLRELAALYEAFCNNVPLVLPELPIQYADFAVWQRQWLQGEVLESQLAYWKQQLDDAPALLELPTDRVRPAVQTFRGAFQTFTLSKELSDALMTLSQRQGATLFMTLLAAFQTLLYRYTGQTDICVGTPVANRNRSEIEELIGFFVNTLVLRTDVSGNPSFEDVVSRAREVALGAYAHQDLPFEQLVEELQPVRSLSYTPLFQVMFALQNAPMPSLELPGLTLNPLATESATAKFDLTLSVENTEQGLVGSWEYNTDLFDAATITRMAGHFQTLLEGIVANPEQRLLNLPLLSAAEQRQLLLEWNDTRADYRLDICIHQLFEAQVERTPDAIAVVFEDQQLTYRELNSKANQLAHHLQTLGVGPEALVSIYVERSLEMVVGLLGILKAGGAYMPLDPAYPKERLAFMLSDAQTSVLLTQEHLVEKLPEHQARVVCLDTNWEVIAQESESNPVNGATAEHLAYVIYTSGSTGTPKGVEIQHAGLVNLVTWHQQVYSVTPADRATQLAGLAFDASIWELWPYLTAGASIHIPPQEILLSPSELLKWLATKAITLCFMPTPLAIAVLEENWPTDLALRVLLTGGDKLYRKPQKALTFSLVNHYGPTENTVVTTYAPVDTVTGSDIAPPIGRPIANTQVYLLDQHLQPVPVGVPGELHIGGAGLARGYLNRPELSAEKFIPNPFSDEPGSRLYKTGDLARYLSDGNIEFLDRIDQQVKIRGFRIELAEIESLLSHYPGVREVAVIVREDVPGDKRLVAYVVPHAEHALLTTDLRCFLEEKLPKYMVPSAFVLLEVLPLTPNGKVDRRALPVPEGLRHELTVDYVAPQSEMERTIAAIWQEVLQVDKVGVHDNFFDLGGHSLLVIQVHTKLRDALNRELSVVDIFQHPTISALANYCSQKTSEQPSFQHNYDRAESRKDSIKQQKQLRQKRRAMNN